ncbi:class I SAM-dependent methyltransferase [Mucilaginibacter auburnensis]|uniref:Methyltransferase family protein n=1 Tax=Mucilaginibacter auburnensis TaxID=1457233 RepID=A0A2H9VVS8_9SPHI|nr:class I SAM-dependent methyltransferase [Mucilaginibacter auburnensis]PJJ84933.1 methyltransferase family protein [Mucilaginibacter auburnensis]
MNDILGQAIFNYYNKTSKQKLWIHNHYGPREEMPLRVYFRGEDDMPDLEWLAIERCFGNVLDVGAGAGSHSLVLQQRNIDVTALDISPLLTQVMIGRGVKKVVQGDIYVYNEQQFDTILLLMNGIGLAATIGGLKQLLLHLKTLLEPGGQILFDSSDVAYLYDGHPPAGKYYGEVAYQYAYNNYKTDWFTWLYIGEHAMQEAAKECGFDMEVLLEDEHAQYLARLTIVNDQSDNEQSDNN